MRPPLYLAPSSISVNGTPLGLFYTANSLVGLTLARLNTSTEYTTAKLYGQQHD